MQGVQPSRACVWAPGLFREKVVEEGQAWGGVGKEGAAASVEKGQQGEGELMAMKEACRQGGWAVCVMAGPHECASARSSLPRY